MRPSIFNAYTLRLITGLGPVLCSLYALPALANETLDDLWSKSRLYQSDTGVLRSFDLSGRLQYDYVHVDASDQHYEDGVWRRFRLGIKSRLGDAWTFNLEADFDLDDDFHSDYSRLTDLWIGWDFTQDWQLRLLKQSAGFTLDGTTSSNNLLTPERNNLANNLWYMSEYFTGIEASGACGENLGCSAGFFSLKDDEELSDFDAGNFTLLSVDADLTQQSGADRWKLSTYYVYNNPQQKELLSGQPKAGATTFVLPYKHILSLVSHWEDGGWGIWSDISGGFGDDQAGNTYGLVAMPFYNLSASWQLVTRYTWLRSDDEYGLAAGRYENRLPLGDGDRYREFYAGLNWFIYGHKLKAQLGAQHVVMDGLDARDSRSRSWGLTLALRTHW